MINGKLDMVGKVLRLKEEEDAEEEDAEDEEEQEQEEGGLY